ncbi:MAG: hypothetical protein LWX07_01315 [Bacteroidetes bacterium]|nr:hypothetical protein [Bacteroidota bacterium]
MKHFITLLLILAVFAAGCGKKQNDGVQDKTRTEAGSTGLTLPADYPSEFPVPPNGKVLSVNISKDGTTVMMQAEMPGARLLHEYRKNAALAGYEEQTPEINGREESNTFSVSFTRKNDNRSVSVAIASGRNGISTVTFLYK